MSRGFIKEGKRNESYVDRANKAVDEIYSVPAIRPIKDDSNMNQVIVRDDEKESTQVSADKTSIKQPWDVYGDFNQ